MMTWPPRPFNLGQTESPPQYITFSQNKPGRFYDLCYVGQNCFNAISALGHKYRWTRFPELEIPDGTLIYDVDTDHWTKYEVPGMPSPEQPTPGTRAVSALAEWWEFWKWF